MAVLDIHRRVVSTLVLAAGILALPTLAAAPTPTVARDHAIEGVALAVTDADRAAEFYSRVLFLETTAEYELGGPGSRRRVVRMRLGDEAVDLIEDSTTVGSVEPVAIVVNDMEQAYLWLRRHHVASMSPAPSPDWDPERSVGLASALWDRGAGSGSVLSGRSTAWTSPAR